MTIRTISRLAGASLALFFLLAAFITAINLNVIRFGGPLYVADREASDLIADILPPPLYIIETHLLASQAQQHPEELAQTSARIDGLHRDFEERQRFWSQAAISPQLKQTMAQAAIPVDAYWRELQGAYLPALRAKNLPAANASFARLEQLYDRHRASIDTLVDQSRRYQADLLTTALQRLKVALIVIGGTAVAFLATLAFAVARLDSRVIRPVRDAADVMEALAAGDFSARLPGDDRHDEIGVMARAIGVFRRSGEEKRIADQTLAEGAIRQQQVVDAMAHGLQALAAGKLGCRIEEQFPEGYEALRADFNDTCNALGGTVQSVARAAESIGSGSGEISIASDNLAQRTEQQAASLAQSAASVQAVSAALTETAADAARMATSIAMTHERANGATQVVDQTVEAMREIESSSRRIGEITSVIDSIAFQTNLLALNAGVEAARAGDAGRGFAVVAAEVRALAQRCSDAARDITTLIATSSQHVKTGVDRVAETGAALNEIVGQVGEVATLGQSISSTTAQQADAMRSVNASISEMDRMTQQNAAMVEESTAAARALKSEGAHLTALVANFDWQPESDLKTNLSRAA